MRETNLADTLRSVTMQHIQENALNLFRDNGYGEVSIEMVASACGVNPATIYRHFGSKEQLVIWNPTQDVQEAAFQATLADRPLVDALRALVQKAEDNEKLRIALRHRMEIVQTNGRLKDALRASEAALGQRFARALDPDRNGPAPHYVAAGRALAALMSGSIDAWASQDTGQSLTETLDMGMATLRRSLSDD